MSAFERKVFKGLKVLVEEAIERKPPIYIIKEKGYKTDARPSWHPTQPTLHHTK
jgi:hypothetical protein